MISEDCIEQSVTEEEKWACVAAEEVQAASDMLEAFKIALA